MRILHSFNYKYFCLTDGTGNSEEEEEQIFNAIFVDILKEISLNEIYKEFHLGPPLLRLFNTSTSFLRNKSELFFEENKWLYGDSFLVFNFDIIYHPKDYKRNPYLEFLCKYHCHSNGVYFGEKKESFTMWLTEYVRR